jgi:hypothetical protein
VAGETPARFTTSALVVLGTWSPFFGLAVESIRLQGDNLAKGSCRIDSPHFYSQVQMMSSCLGSCRVQKLA